MYTVTTTAAIASGTHAKYTVGFNKSYIKEPIVVMDDFGTGYSFIPVVSELSKSQCTVKIYNYTSGSLEAGRSVRLRVYGVQL